MKKISLALATTVALSASYAVAEDSEYPGWIGVFGEYYNPDNNKPEPVGYLEDGKGGGAEIGWHFDEAWAIRAEIARDFLGRKKSRLAGRDAEYKGNRYGADILYFISRDDWYVFTGLKHQELQGQRTLLDVGLGKHWRLAKRWKAISEVAAYQDLDESLLDFGLKLGIAYEFGMTSQPASRVAQVKKTEEMTVRDSDQDGVVDNLDRCPQSAAGAQVDARGCVVVRDRDNDGVVDTADQCPSTPAGTAVNAQGCALVTAVDVVVTDSDNDGVSDDQDTCANTPATDKVDANGCSVFTEKEVSISMKVNFGNNSAVVTNPNDPQFEKFAGFMKRFPNTEAVIEGHSSAGGAASYNLKLSQQRADAVRTLLIDQYGVEASRLKAKGYGESRLLDTSGTAEAAKRNRRIEVKVTATQVTKEQK